MKSAAKVVMIIMKVKKIIPTGNKLLKILSLAGAI